MRLLDPKLLVLLAAGSLTTMAGGVVAPILPEIVQQLQIDPGWAGTLVSVHALTIAIFSPPLGIVADRFGRLRVLVVSLVFYALFGVGAVFMPSFWFLLLMRALLGAATGGIAAASLGLLSNMYEGQARSQALGYTTSTLTLAGIIFPLLGGLVGGFHWKFAFCLYGLALPLALCAGLNLQQKPSSPTKVKENKSNQKLLKVLAQPYALWLLLALGLASITMYAVVIYAPLYLKATIGATTTLNGVVLSARAIGAAIVSAFGTRKLAKIFGLTKTITLGFGLMAITIVTIPLLQQVQWILLTAVFFGFGFGIVLPNLYNALANLAPANLRSSVLAVGIGAGFLGQFLSPILLGPVLGFAGLAGVFYAAGCVSVLAGLLLLFNRKKLPATEI